MPLEKRLDADGRVYLVETKEVQKGDRLERQELRDKIQAIRSLLDNWKSHCDTRKLAVQAELAELIELKNFQDNP